MKKVEVEKLVSKSIIITAILLCLILGTVAINNGYSNFLVFNTTTIVNIVASIIFAVLAVAMVFLGVFKDSKFYKYATASGAIAVFVMILYVNYRIRPLEFMIKTRVIKFYVISMFVLCLAILITWLRTAVKLIKE